MLVALRRTAGFVAVFLVGLSVLVFGPTAVTPAEAFAGAPCPGSACPTNLVVAGILAESSGGTAVATTASAAATASTAAGVSGISYSSVAAGLALSTTGAAAAVGVTGWSQGWWDVEGDAAGLPVSPGVPAGFPAGQTYSRVQGAVTYLFRIDGLGHAEPAYGQATAPAVAVAYRWEVRAPQGYGGNSPSTAYVECRNASGSRLVINVGSFASPSWTTGASGVVSGTGSANVAARACSGLTGGYLYGWAFGTLPQVTPASLDAEVAAGRAIVHYPAGNPQAPPATEGGSGTITQRLTCVGPGGTSQTFEQSIPANVAEAGRFEVPALTCPSGMVAGSFGADWTPSGGQPVPLVPNTQTLPEVQALPTEYPACMGSACTLELYKVRPGGGVDYCGVGAMACPDWYSTPLPQRATEYECHFGPYVVETHYCSVYRVPGQVSPNTTVKPDGTTEVTEWPPLPMPEPVPGGETPASECWPNGWSWNPRDWILQPLKCAFVPQHALQTALVSDAFNDSALGQMSPTVGQIGAAFAGLGDNQAKCGVITDAPISAFNEWHLVIDTCGYPWSSMGPVRNVLGIGFMVGAVIIGVRSVLKTIRVETSTAEGSP